MTLYHSIVVVKESDTCTSTIKSKYAVDKQAARRRATRWATYSKDCGNEVVSVRIEPVRG